MFSSRWLLIYILVFAFLVRIVGIGYGLPLWLIDDEPPFTLAALKMLQLKTLFPASYLEEFKTILYYPPYLSYLYLLPFFILLGMKYLIFNGGMEQFIYYLTSNLSQFFIIARLINVVLGTISVFLVYKISKNIFSEVAPALFGSFFLGVSLAYIMFSSVGRHWLPVSVFFVLILFFLSHKNWSFHKRYFLAILAAGIGIGISPIIGIAIILILLWYFFYEQRKLAALLTDKLFYPIYLAFGGLVVLPAVIYPRSFGFRGDLTAAESKTILGIIQSPFLFLKPVFLSEPILVLGAVLGLIFLWIKKKNLFWAVSLFIFAYSAIFYWLFRYEHRFTLPLVPILALLAGYGVWSAYQAVNFKRIAVAVIFILCLILTTISLRFGYLVYNDDSRIHLRNWVEENLPAGSKILVYARLTRLSSTKTAIKEQELLDPGSLRRVDLAEANLVNRKGKLFHALNLYDVNNQEFYDNLEKYARDNNYQYIFFGGTDQREFNKLRNFQEIAGQGELLKSFGEFQEAYSSSIGQLLGNPFYLFKLKEFGPPIAIYKLF